MRNIAVTKNYTLYTFDELSESAKERVKEWYLDGQDVNTAEEIAKDIIFNIFGHSELKIQFDISCCQGDGANIYGRITPDNVLHAAKIYGIKFNMTEKEKRRLAFYSECSDGEKLEYNPNGYYTTVDELEEYNRMSEYTEGLRDIDTKLIDRYIRLLIDVVEKAENEIYNALYSYFYEISDEELSAICENNEWEFLEDGTYYFA